MKILIKIFIASSVFFTSLYSSNQLESIKSKGEIVIGIKNDFDPFGFVSRSGKIIGFDIDIAEYIAKSMGLKLVLKVVTSKNRIEKLLSNEVDILIASMSHTIKRDSNIDFSIAYFYDGQAILAQKGHNYSSFRDFTSHKIGAVKGSTSGLVFETIQPASKVIYYATYKKLMKALKNKKVDAITSDYSFLKTAEKKSIGAFKLVGKPFTIEPYGIGINENQSKLKDEINFTIQKAVKDGKYNEIYKKWFKKLPSKRPILWP